MDKPQIPNIEGSDILLQFHEWGTSCPVQYDIDYRGHNYYIRYRFGWLSITLDIDTANIDVFGQELCDDGYDGFWSDEATNVYLALISRAIIDDKIAELKLPTKAVIRLHPLYREGPFLGYDPQPNDGPLPAEPSPSGGA